eukprot:scaffold64326_cov59-Phaeocystis_antarctica.AAC.8
MRLRREWHWMSCLLSSSTPVVGEVNPSACIAFGTARVRLGECAGHKAAGLSGGGEERTVVTGSVMISDVIEHMYSSGTATSLASGGPAAPLLPPSPPSVAARSNALASASAAAAAAAAVTATSRALDAAATRAAARAASCAATCAATHASCAARAATCAAASRACSAAASLTASAADSCFALRSASSSSSSSSSICSRRNGALTTWADPPASSSSSSSSSSTCSRHNGAWTTWADPPASRSAADTAGLGAVAGSELSEAAGGTPLGSSAVAAAARPAVFCFLVLSKGGSSARSARAACSACVACGAATAAGCGDSACCRMGPAVVVRPLALKYRAPGRRGRFC